MNRNGVRQKSECCPTEIGISVRQPPEYALIAANVYLYAASQGLAAWFHNCNREAAAKDFKLRADQRVLFAQTVGYPA
jgi:hypothetical protein